MRRVLLVVCSLTFAACNCGLRPSACSAASCSGCCDSNGECHAGTESLACGVGGAQCAACSPVQQCQLGFCRDLGAGGGTATGGGAGGGGGATDAGDVDAGELDAGSDDAGLFDSGVEDAGSEDAGAPDSGVNDAGFDAGIRDAGAPDSGVPDAGRPDAGPPDAGPPDAGPTHVHILISNTCVVQVQPPMITAPLNSNLRLQFHNHSVDYEADVWSSRGYGYLELALGGLWNDPINHCGGPMAYTEYFDIDIAGGGGSACPGVRLNIRCQ